MVDLTRDAGHVMGLLSDNRFLSFSMPHILVFGFDSRRCRWPTGYVAISSWVSSFANRHSFKINLRFLDREVLDRTIVASHYD